MSPSDSPRDDAASQSGASELVDIQLRWGDLDLNAHVNNVIYARLLEEARVRAMSRWFSDGVPRIPVLVARQDIEFRSVLHYSPDPVVVGLAITRLGTSSYTIGSTITAPDGTLCAVARTTMVTIDPTTSRPMPIPPAVREVLATYQGELPDLRG